VFCGVPYLFLSFRRKITGSCYARLKLALIYQLLLVFISCRNNTDQFGCLYGGAIIQVFFLLAAECSGQRMNQSGRLGFSLKIHEDGLQGALSMANLLQFLHSG